LLDEKIDAQTALAFGLANKVFPDDQLDSEAAKIVAKFAGGPVVSSLAGGLGRTRTAPKPGQWATCCS